jgi:hypothetical protein
MSARFGVVVLMGRWRGIDAQFSYSDWRRYPMNEVDDLLHVCIHGFLEILVLEFFQVVQVQYSPPIVYWGTVAKLNSFYSALLFLSFLNHYSLDDLGF